VKRIRNAIDEKTNRKETFVIYVYEGRLAGPRGNGISFI
jgi:hypothetical protein